MGLVASVEYISGRGATRKVLLAYDSIGNGIGQVHVVMPAYPLKIAERSEYDELRAPNRAAIITACPK